MKGRSHQNSFTAPLQVFVLLVLAISASVGFAQQEPNRQLVQRDATRGGNARRIALVIGNGAYTAAPGLKNPPNDARDMAAMLRTLGFDVTSGVNLNQRDMKRLIREFGMKLKSGGSGLFYYAGHGVQSRGRNYLIPVDANIQSEAEVEDSGVDAALILNFMDDAQNGLNIVILDACRNNPFARSFRSASDGLAQVDAPTGTLIAYATAPGRVASDGSGQNGLYTSELLKQMQVRDVSITDMFMRVRGEVMKQTGNKQVPWEASSLVGSFYFNGGSGALVPVATDSRIDASAFELSYWETIKNSTNAEDFKAYIARYPKGQFAELATNRIKAIEVAAKPVERNPVSRDTAGATEIAFWDSIKNSTTASDYLAYLEKYPDGSFASLARSRLARLEAAEKNAETEKSRQVEAAELARLTRSFKASWGIKMALASSFHPGRLTISPKMIEFVFDGDQSFKAGQVFPVECSTLKSAILDKSSIREVEMSNHKFRFNFNSSTDATDAFALMREMCKGE